MKKKYFLSSILFFIGFMAFLISGIVNRSKPLPGGAPSYVYFIFQYGYFIAAACMLIAAIGFALSYIYHKPTDTEKN